MKNRKTGFGFSSRDSHRSLKTDMPGPGHYNPKDIDKLDGPSFKYTFENFIFLMNSRFGMENKDTLSFINKTSPGPGQYEMKKTFGSTGGFSIYGKLDQDFTKNEKKPGPEAYDPRPVKSSSAISFL